MTVLYSSQTLCMSNDNCRKYQPIFVNFSGNVDDCKDTKSVGFGSDRPPPFKVWIEQSWSIFFSRDVSLVNMGVGLPVRGGPVFLFCLASLLLALTQHSLAFTLHSLAFTLHSLASTLHSLAFTLHSLAFNLHSLAFTLHSFAFTCIRSHSLAFVRIHLHSLAFTCNRSHSLAFTRIHLHSPAFTHSVYTIFGSRIPLDVYWFLRTRTKKDKRWTTKINWTK